eukprot:scaffold8122_cov62-Isochrysis_galbana.AAC.1
MNLLEERLKHSNSAVVLGATKVFLHLTQDMPQLSSGAGRDKRQAMPHVRSAASLPLCRSQVLPPSHCGIAELCLACSDRPPCGIASQVHAQVYLRLRAPMMTLVAGG